MLNQRVFYIYIGLLLFYRFAESWAMRKTGSAGRRPNFEKTMLLIMVPYFLVILLPPVEASLFDRCPSIIWMAAGGVLIVLAALVRVRAHLDIGASFSMAVEQPPAGTLSKQGLYSVIRHPLYLGNALLFLGCPVFMASRFSWMAAALGLAGIILRIELEEEYLMDHVDGYREYRQETYKIIPSIY